MTILERAARALCKAQSGTDCYDDLEPEAQERVQDHARAVLQAIREPSEAMLEADVGAALSLLGAGSRADVFTAMIDAALADQDEFIIIPRLID